MAIAQIAKAIYDKTKKKKKKSITDLKTKDGYPLAGTGKPRMKKNKNKKENIMGHGKSYGTPIKKKKKKNMKSKPGKKSMPRKMGSQGY